MNNKQVMGEHLKKARTDKGIGLDKLSEMSGLSKTQIGNIEQGRTNYTIDTLVTYLYHTELDLVVSGNGDIYDWNKLAKSGAVLIDMDKPVKSSRVNPFKRGENPAMIINQRSEDLNKLDEGGNS